MNKTFGAYRILSDNNTVKLMFKKTAKDYFDAFVFLIISCIFTFALFFILKGIQSKGLHIIDSIIFLIFSFTGILNFIQFILHILLPKNILTFNKSNGIIKIKSSIFNNEIIKIEELKKIKYEYECEQLNTFNRPGRYKNRQTMEISLILKNENKILITIMNCPYILDNPHKIKTKLFKDSIKIVNILSAELGLII